WLDPVVRRGGGARGKGRGQTKSITFFLSPPAVSPFRGLEEPPRCPARSRRPDLSPGAAHDLEVVIDEADNALPAGSCLPPGSAPQCSSSPSRSSAESGQRTSSGPSTGPRWRRRCLGRRKGTAQLMTCPQDCCHPRPLSWCLLEERLRIWILSPSWEVLPNPPGWVRCHL
ncbi:unnamed protein product, partial [Gulo gulo]